MRALHKLLILSLILAAVVAGFSLGRIIDSSRQSALSSTSQVHDYPLASDLIGQPRPDFLLPDLRSQPRQISEWNGQALLINFWATWCAPCRDEIPALNSIRNEFKQNGFEVVGVAIDLPGLVAEFSHEARINYPLLVGQVAADQIIRHYGNSGGGLPYSVFIDKKGIIRSIHSTGPLDEAQLREKVLDLLKNQTINQSFLNLAPIWGRFHVI